LIRRALVSLALVAVIALIFFTSGCAVPLAPEYDVKRQTEDVHFVTSGSPELQIRSTYTLQNTGTAPLDFIDVDFPNEKVFGRTGVEVTIDGKSASANPLPAEYQAALPDALRIPFPSPLGVKDRHELVIEYAFRAPVLSGPQITLNADNFHLGTRGWLPVMIPPSHVLSPEPVRPDKTQYTIRVPNDFLVVARGARAGSKKDGAETKYRYKLGPNDFNIYVVAGRYVDSASGGKDAVSFWTATPLTEAPTHADSEIAAAWAVMEKQFGPLDKNVRAAHVVESEGFGPQGPNTDGATALSFPGGALVNPAALALGVNSDKFLSFATQAVAEGWFSNKVYPASNAAIGIGGGLAGYATIVIDEARGGDAARRARIAGYIRQYDEALQNLASQEKDGKPLTEESIAATLPDDPYAQRAVSLAKAPLLFAALADQCGGEKVRKGIVNMMNIMAGQEVDYEVLRSAIEQTCEKDIAATFRVWLNRTGIPQDFRARYAAAQ
jgi:phage tail protein X